MVSLEMILSPFGASWGFIQTRSLPWNRYLLLAGLTIHIFRRWFKLFAFTLISQIDNRTTPTTVRMSVSVFKLIYPYCTSLLFSWFLTYINCAASLKHLCHVCSFRIPSVRFYLRFSRSKDLSSSESVKRSFKF